MTAPRALSVLLVAASLAGFAATAGAQAEGAAQKHEQAVEMSPARASLALGGEALAANRLDAAEAHFTAALEAASDGSERAMAELGLTRVFELRGDLATALVHARRAEDAVPNDAATGFIVGRLLATMGATREAIATLERVRQLAPTNPNPPLLEAFVLRDEGQFDAALALLEEVWSKGVTSLAIAEQIGALSLTLDRPERTVEITREVLLENPDLAEFQLLLGLALAKDTNRRSEAIATLRKALALGVPDPALASLELGILLLAEGDHEAALAALDAAAELEPGNPEIHYRRAAALRMAGDADGARQALERFQALRSETDQVASEAKRLGTELNRAFTLTDENRLDEALAVLDEILASAPDNARVHGSRAKVLYSMGRPEEALAAAARAREIDPSRSEHHLLEGVFLLALGRAQEAEAAERQALALDPELSRAHVLLGGALAKQARPEEAARHFEMALELGADSPPLRLGYADVLETLGRLEESEEQMAAYRRLREALAAGVESEATAPVGDEAENSDKPGDSES